MMTSLLPMSWLAARPLPATLSLITVVLLMSMVVVHRVRDPNNQTAYSVGIGKLGRPTILRAMSDFLIMDLGTVRSICHFVAYRGVLNEGGSVDYGPKLRKGRQTRRVT